MFDFGNAIAVLIMSVFGRKPATVRIPGDGVARASERLAAKRKANLSIPMDSPTTRQQMRAMDRRNNPKITPAEADRRTMAARKAAARQAKAA